MNRAKVVRLVTAGLVIGSAAFGFAPMASASSDLKLTPSVEAWFQPNLTCLLPTGCLTTGTLPVTVPVEIPALPAANPYPAGTMHVGVTAGRESSRTYLRFPFDQLDGKNVTAATLTIPVDGSPADGTTLPESSKVLICETSSSNFTATEGTTVAPPPNDCAVSVAATYVATPTPHLQAVLGKMAADLPGITGLVLLPDASKIAQTDAWAIAWSAHTRTGATTGPASLAVTYDDGTTDDLGTDDGSGDGTTAPSEPTVANPGTGIAADPGTGFAAPTVQEPSTVDLAPTVQAPAAAAPQTTEPQLVTVGYAYPIVWLLPLGFLILVPATARALTKDLSVSDE